MSDVDVIARSLYDARSKPCPSISDSAWEQVKLRTPNHYRTLTKVAEGLLDND